jgi:hypothetical protein
MDSIHPFHHDKIVVMELQLFDEKGNVIFFVKVDLSVKEGDSNPG